MGKAHLSRLNLLSLHNLLSAESGLQEPGTDLIALNLQNKLYQLGPQVITDELGRHVHKPSASGPCARPSLTEERANSLLT